MLKAADKACLFCAPPQVKSEFPQFKAVEKYDDLLKEIKNF
jgi:phosphoserine/homoserine phosphotransferase